LDGHIGLWNAISGEALQQLQLEENTQTDEVVFTPDGSQMVSAGLNGIIKFWDPATGQELLTIKAHQSFIWGLAISPDGHTVATAAGDETASLWDIQTGERRLTLTGHTGAVNSVEFSPDGRQLITSSFDGTVRGYILPLDEAMNLARSRLTRTWTVEECQRFLHQEACPAWP
jgi:WD40 repeat protein